MDSAAITGTMPVLKPYEPTSPMKDVPSGPISKLEPRHDHRHREHTARSVDVFRQEFRSQLKAKFSAFHAGAQPQYGTSPSPASADEVASEALAAAKAITSTTSPERAAKSVITFRSVVRESIEVVRNTLGERDDSAELNDAAGKIENGLTELESDIANTREATTAVLAVDARSKQSTKIRIRTQEGDIVSLSLRNVDRLKAGDASYSDGEFSASSTSVELSSSSRMRLSVKGDLNDSELAAIQSVFAKAESMAESYYGGDFAAAFNAAQDFEFDTSALAKVKMRFRSSAVSNVSYLQAAQPAPASADETMSGKRQPVPAPDIMPAPLPPQPMSSSTDSAAVRIEAGDATETANAQAAVETLANASAPATNGEPAAAPVLADNAIAGFFQMISAFSRSVSESFELGSNGSSYRYQYSETFKLDILKAVFATAAPAGAETAAQNAAQLIDAASAASEIEEA